MGIKNKQGGQKLPTATEQWQVYAHRGDITTARQYYRHAYPKVALVEAHRTVSEYMSKHKITIQHRQG